MVAGTVSLWLEDPGFDPFCDGVECKTLHSVSVWVTPEASD